MADQKNAVSDLDRKIAELNERIAGLRYRAIEKAAMFGLVAETLHQENAEYVIGENRPVDPNIVPLGLAICIPTDLIETTIKITDDLRISIGELRRLEKLRSGVA